MAEQNIVQYLYSATLDLTTVKSATTTMNSATSKSTTANSNAFKQSDIKIEIRNSATLFSTTLNCAT